MALVEYADAAPEVRAVFDDIKATRGVADVNNFWKALAVHPATLKRTWESLQQVMAPGALDPTYQGNALSGGLSGGGLCLLHRIPHGGCQSQGHDRRDAWRITGRAWHGGGDEPLGGSAPRANRSGPVKTQ
jgi:hypothetical protein